MRVLVSGGAGYIGTHTLLSLFSYGHEVAVVDDLSNSSSEALRRVRKLSNKDFEFTQADICDYSALNRLFSDFKPDAVIHFAGLKAVGESETYPMRYYEKNVAGSLNLLKAMDAHKCRRIIFSSSATVYGEPDYLPFDETHQLNPVNPYGRTKYFVEQIIHDWAATDRLKTAVLLRYFNPVGAHSSGEIGEDPLGIPNNLVPFIAQVAVGRRDQLKIFGNDYNTPDGTGVRDYIHVTDLAEGHLAALNFSISHQGVEAINLGTGKGYSVLDVVQAFAKASKKDIPHEFVARRPGDVDSSYADIKKAKKLLGWQSKLGLNEMCEDVWRWQSQNPEGYGDQ